MRYRAMFELDSNWNYEFGKARNLPNQAPEESARMLDHHYDANTVGGICDRESVAQMSMGWPRLPERSVAHETWGLTHQDGYGGLQ